MLVKAILAAIFHADFLKMLFSTKMTKNLFVNFYGGKPL